MKRNSLVIFFASAAAGLLGFYMIKRANHRKWIRKREEILARARRKDHGEFVL